MVFPSFAFYKGICLSLIHIYVIPVLEAQKSYNFVRRYELIFTIGFCVMASMLFLWGFVKNRSKNKQLIQAAETDALTSAYNKRSTEERIHNVLQEHPQDCLLYTSRCV